VPTRVFFVHRRGETAAASRDRDEEPGSGDFARPAHVPSPPVQRTVLFVGAGRHQRRAILRAQELGLRVAAVDRNPDAPGLAEADIARVVDFSELEPVLAAIRRLRIDGVLTISADRAVPVVAALAERLGLPGIGVETAHLMTHKVAMRRELAEAGVPQPRFAALRTLGERRRAANEVGFPAVLKPADSGGQRGVFRVESLDELEAHLYEALAASPTGEAILEEFVDGTEMNGIVVARDRETKALTLSDRLRPPGLGFGVGWIHVYPATVYGFQLEESERVATHAVHALGLGTGIAFPQLIAAPDGRVVVVECAARVPGGQMADLVLHAVGVDLIEVQLRMALGDELPDELVLPRFRQPLAIRFLTAEPGPLPTGRVKWIGSLEKVLAFPGVVQAETYLQPGEVIRPVRLDGDRRGYVIAVGDTNLEALERAEAAARLVDVEVEAA
jgi:biotin carboxylase